MLPMTLARGQRWFVRSRITLLLLLLIGFRTIPGMRAQNAPARSEALTLSDAIEMDLKQNLDLQIANIEAARQWIARCFVPVRS
jgi:hypothetical protein